MKDYSQVNILDCINHFDERVRYFNENANSRLIAQLFGVRRNGRFEIFESFMERFFGEKFNGVIHHPDISNEKHRIDILVQEEGSYACIFENKIYGAEQQKCQLASYIRDMRKDGYKDEQIYVIYLPPTEKYEVNECSWTLHSNRCEGCGGIKCKVDNRENNLEDKFKDRYRCITFKDQILPWLKDVLKRCRDDEWMLKSAVIQYIDYLEGYFKFRTINNDITMEVEKFIKERLGLTDDTCKNFDKIAAQVKDIKDLLKYLNGMQDNYNQEAMNELRNSWESKYPGHQTIFVNDENERWPYVAIVLSHTESNLKLKVFLAYDSKGRSLYYGIMPYKKEERAEVINLVEATAKTRKNCFRGDNWIFYWNTNYTNAEENVDELIDMLRKIGVE